LFKKLLNKYRGYVDGFEFDVPTEEKASHKRDFKDSKPAKLSICDEDLMYDFEDKYGQKIAPLLSKMWKYAESTDGTAESQKRGYEKAIAYAETIKDFCESKGKIGKLYYQEIASSDIQMLKNEFEDYMNNQYAEALAYDKERTEYEAKLKEIRNIILKAAQADDGVLQIELYPRFGAENKNIVLRAIDELYCDGKITKARKGNTNLLKAVK